MILETGAFAKYEIAGRYIRARCQIHGSREDVLGLIEPTFRQQCAREPNIMGLDAEIAVADVVILAAEWKPWAAERLPKLLETLDFGPDQTVIVVGRKNLGEIRPLDYYFDDPSQLGSEFGIPEKEQIEVTSIMRATIGPEIFVDVHAMLCPTLYRCRQFTSKGDLISFDGAHLTRRGARYLGALVFDDPLLRPFSGTPPQTN